MAAEPHRRHAVILISGPTFEPDLLMARAIQQLRDKVGENLQAVDLVAAIEAYEPRHPGDFALASELMTHDQLADRSDRWSDNQLSGESWGRIGKRRRKTR